MNSSRPVPMAALPMSGSVVDRVDRLLDDVADVLPACRAYAHIVRTTWARTRQSV